MRIIGLKPTHFDPANTYMEYAQHEGIWYFIRPISFDGESYEWAISEDHKHGTVYLKEIRKIK